MPGHVSHARAQIMNFGTAPESNIPVYCHIDSAGTTIYNHNFTYVGPLAPGELRHLVQPRMDHRIGRRHLQRDDVHGSGQRLGPLR